LIDWDLSKPDGNSTRTRTGAWQCLSVEFTWNPTAARTLQDDLESALHVLLWTALSF
ncbi:hypothetical protein PAXRUDRAFT_120046, partial [Paxillus rubicundulus Ve08.2h10]